MENLDFEKDSEETINENNAVQKFRRDIVMFLVIFNVLALLVAMFIPTPMYKPAIYLYPKQQTKINVKLSKTIFIKTNIPKYHNGWYVLANPNGKIVDLQPQFTDCKKLKSTNVGFEYAQKACETNNYPYIFWDGIQMTKLLPKKANGWVVPKKEITKFLNDKLNKIGFNPSERIDFINYWQHKLTQEKSNYYFIYFLQNDEMDKYAPMYVNPKPDSLNRIFMVAKPINKPFKVKEQNLQKISRKGFAVVEWGGVLKKGWALK